MPNRALEDCIKVQKMNGVYNTPMGALVREIVAKHLGSPRKKKISKGRKTRR